MQEENPEQKTIDTLFLVNENGFKVEIQLNTLDTNDSFNKLVRIGYVIVLVVNGKFVCQLQTFCLRAKTLDYNLKAAYKVYNKLVKLRTVIGKIIYNIHTR